MIAAFLAWWRETWDGAWDGPGHPAHAEMLAAIDREARTERMQSLRWVCDTTEVEAPDGWAVDRIDVEAAGIIPYGDGVMRWMLLRLHLSRG